MLNKIINKMHYSGTWYSNRPAELEQSVEKFVDFVTPVAGKVYGAVLPHAGHCYSGKGIAHFFANDFSDIKRLIILAPSHYSYLSPNTITCGDFSEYETPIGNIRGGDIDVDRTIFQLNNRAVEVEHSTEIFFPFVKKYLPDVEMLVFLVSEINSSSELEKISSELAKSINYSPEEDVIIASSDFSHYGRRFGYVPFGDDYSSDLECEVEALDRKYADMLANAKITEIYQNLRLEVPTICGIYPAMLASSILSRAGIQGELVSYYNSNSIAGPSDEFVCYATILFLKNEN